MTSVFDYKSYLKTLTKQPGVYQMLGYKDVVLYVGKAQNLKKRVSSYFQRSQNPRIHALISRINRIEVIVTDTENEALLLENNLIKKLNPRYNVLFRDDKSYPYLFLSKHKDFPRLDFHRGAKVKKGRYFGPYPSSGAVRETLRYLQKLFRIRQCSDTFFKNRSRACIQYQIKRCTAPCVGLISPELYLQNVHLAELFLCGKNKRILEHLMCKMDQSSEQLDYEGAARIRDQIAQLRSVQEKQNIISDAGDVDVIAAVKETNEICVQVLFIRAGRLIGNHNYFSKTQISMPIQEILISFISQFYFNAKHKHDIPQHIFVNEPLKDVSLLEQSLTRERGKGVKISRPLMGSRFDLKEMAIKNANAALASRLDGKASYQSRLEMLRDALGFNNTPKRLECFDVSHSMGEATVASCVVFGQDGPVKDLYRRFNIKGVASGDDYAALRQAMLRRYTSLKEKELDFPDVIIIDGGKGQLTQAEAILDELQVRDIALIGIAKGPSRKAGLETIFTSKKVPIKFAADSKELHILQMIRDEAHRFAIQGHRNRRAKGKVRSILEDIQGIGKKRRQQLLHYFGGIQGMRKASAKQLSQVPGISVNLAKKIYDNLHPS